MLVPDLHRSRLSDRADGERPLVNEPGRLVHVPIGSPKLLAADGQQPDVNASSVVRAGRMVGASQIRVTGDRNCRRRAAWHADVTIVRVRVPAMNAKGPGHLHVEPAIR